LISSSLSAGSYWWLVLLNGDPWLHGASWIREVSQTKSLLYCISTLYEGGNFRKALQTLNEWAPWSWRASSRRDVMAMRWMMAMTEKK
jgi:hypothetical protein